MSKTLKIVFMGTPDFAVPSLRALHADGYRISWVVTQPDRPKGRGRQVIPPPVKVIASELGLKVMQPTSLRDQQISETLLSLKPDFLVVIAFGQIIPASLLKIPRLGAVNVHASLLPKYRGPAPVQWAIIKGEKQTGVTTMLMDPGIDTGPILLTRTEPILDDDTAASLHDRLAVLGAQLLIETLDALAGKRIEPVPQDHALATYAPMLSKSDGRIDWYKSATSLAAFIRGVTPWPGAFTWHAGNRLKILKAKPIIQKICETPGTVLKGFPGELRVATGDGILLVEEIQGPSGKRLGVEEFLRGYQLPPGAILA